MAGRTERGWLCAWFKCPLCGLLRVEDHFTWEVVKGEESQEEVRSSLRCFDCDQLRGQENENPRYHSPGGSWYWGLNEASDRD